MKININQAFEAEWLWKATKKRLAKKISIQVSFGAERSRKSKAEKKKAKQVIKACHLIQVYKARKPSQSVHEKYNFEKKNFQSSWPHTFTRQQYKLKAGKGTEVDSNLDNQALPRLKIYNLSNNYRLFLSILI